MTFYEPPSDLSELGRRLMWQSCSFGLEIACNIEIHRRVHVHDYSSYSFFRVLKVLMVCTCIAAPLAYT